MSPAELSIFCQNKKDITEIVDNVTPIEKVRTLLKDNSDILEAFSKNFSTVELEDCQEEKKND